jgi:hypothetical protein
MLFSTANYPTAYSLWSCIVTCLMLVPVFLLYPSKWAVPSKEMFLGPSYALTLIIVFLCADMGFTNSAIAELNLALQQCIAATVPFWTVIIESLKNNKWQHPLIYLVVSVVVVGTILTVMGQMEPPSTWGLVAAVLAVLSSASKSVFTHAAFMQYKKQLPSMAMLFWLDVFMAPIFIVWSLSNGELQALLTSGMDFTAWMQFTLTAALGGVRALAGFFLLILTSPTSNAIGNVITQQVRRRRRPRPRPRPRQAVAQRLHGTRTRQVPTAATPQKHERSRGAPPPHSIPVHLPASPDESPLAPPALACADQHHPRSHCDREHRLQPDAHDGPRPHDGLRGHLRVAEERQGGVRRHHAAQEERGAVGARAVDVAAVATGHVERRSGACL